MIVDIKKIIIKDRIRKDFGDIKELADDIKQNGLINPPVVNKEYELLAGERRLRACKSLGWNQIEVRMMDTRDAEHELNVEISENDVRKGFTKSERVDYMKRLLRIEEAKAKERMSEGGKGSQKSDNLRADEEVSKQFDISRDTLRKEITITDNKNLLNPSDFADWDEGKLSTNKAFQKIKAKLNDSERKAKEESERYERKVQQLQQQLDERPVIKKEVEVIPDDYEELKKKANLAKAYEKDYKNEQQKVVDAKNKNLELQNKIKELMDQTAQATSSAKLIEGSIYFVAQCGSFVRDMGGYVWIADKIAELPERERADFIKAISAIRDWAEILQQNIERNM